MIYNFKVERENLFNDLIKWMRFIGIKFVYIRIKE